MAEKSKETQPVIDIEALKAELLAQLRAEREAEEAGAAAAKSEEERIAEAYLNEPVTIRLFKDGKDHKDDLVVHLNGRNVAIQRGHNVTVPRKIAIIIEQHERQDIAAAEFAEARQAEYKEQVKRYNI